MLSAGAIERADILLSTVVPPVDEPGISPEIGQFIFDLAVGLMNGTPHRKLPSLTVLSEFARRLKTQTRAAPEVLFNRLVLDSSDLLARRDLGLSLRMGQNEPPLLPHNQLLLEVKRAGYASRIGMLLQEVV